jgi:hypothetical protein
MAEMKKDQIEEQLDLKARFGKGKGKNRKERNNKGSETKLDSCDSGTGYLPFGMHPYRGPSTRYL